MSGPPKPSGWRRLLTAAVALAMPVAMLVALPAIPAQAATSTVTLSVISARTELRALSGAARTTLPADLAVPTGVKKGDPVPNFKYIINEDNTGTTAQRSPALGSGCSTSDEFYPDSCKWPSIQEVPHATSPIIAQGDQADFAGGLTLPAGRYLISVLADGYKLDGEHFTVPLPDPGLVTVELQPHPLPDSTLRAQIFKDNAPTDGQIGQGEVGLAGFIGQINDTLGAVQSDVYGNPLCTTYVGEDLDTYAGDTLTAHGTHEIPDGSLDADKLPIVDVKGAGCLSDSTGMLTIPHLGTNRYALTATPPNGQTWIQTTTLEGNHDWDAWLMEGSTGYDTEFLVAGEPVPTPIFGFAQPTNTLAAGATGHVTGVVVGVKQYTPPTGGDFNYWLGLTGSKTGKPIKMPWLSLADLGNADQAVWVGKGDVNGAFDISGVPDGNYQLSWWDEPQNYFLNMVNVTVSNGQTVEMGQIPISGWWTEYDGYVFNDTNSNGKKDAGEPGVPNFGLTMRKKDNSLMDRGTNAVSTDANGYYHFESAYPLSEWVVMEAYSDSFYTTGVTYQADNQPSPTTVRGAGVDVSTLPIIGLSGSMDWGVRSYDAAGNSGGPRNGGIVGSVSYDTTRNELDPQFAASEDWQPGISDIPVKLYATVDCGTSVPVRPCDEMEQYELASDGSYFKGNLLNSYLSENWQRPTGCTARNVDGVPLVHGVDENVLVPTQETTGECIGALSNSVQFGAYGTDQEPLADGSPNPAANFGASVDGNYGFGDACNGTLDASDPANPVCTGGTFEPLGSGTYLVQVEIPDAPVSKDSLNPTPKYKVTAEEDINIANGNQIVPQVPPPACAGALHTVDVRDGGTDTDNYVPLVGDGTNGAPLGVTVPASTPVDNTTIADIGGTVYEGTPQPRCDTKLVTVNNGKSIVPMFNIFTDVPIPSRLRGLIVDDINYNTDPRSTLYGEKSGIPFAPVGIYDFSNRLVTTVESDFNGTYDVLLPSSNHISCPTPSGVCASMYRFVGNDPGAPTDPAHPNNHLNANYNPRFRTIATEFEAIPGVAIPTDLAPTQVGTYLESPTTGVNKSVTCPVAVTTPQLFTVSAPYVNGSGSFTINGTGFGATPGQVTLDNVALGTTWSDTAITATVPAGFAVGAHQLEITASNGQVTANGLTFHVRGGTYTPALREVGPGHTFATIQAALDEAFNNPADDLVIVYPGAPDLVTPNANPRGAYYENLVVASPVKLQGVGPGGFQGTTFVPGSVIDASAFGGDTQVATDWFAKVGGLTWDGNQAVNDGEAIYVLASENAPAAANTTAARQFTDVFKASIDGFDIRGGNQMGFPGNINELAGTPTGLPPNIVTQGGAIFANAYARHLQITNNVVQNNGGGYGTIRIGTPDLAEPNTDQHNENVRIADNRLISNGGTNLAGALGLFAGSDSYEVAGNDICGNFTLEYGGGLSAYGYSPGGKIHHNRIYLNSSNDEGGGIMIAGELPATPGTLSPGSGPVDIYANQIQANNGNDDGGGIRFLMAGNYPMNVYNNMIVNNVSTHEGGGVSLNDAPNVRVYNNTIMDNLTTATALTSNGQPMPAGLSSSANSDQLQATLPGGVAGCGQAGNATCFSKPLLFNNIFWDNRAGTRAGTTVNGLGLAGDLDINNWDVGVGDGTGVLAPTNSVVQQDAGVNLYTTSTTNRTTDPLVVDDFDVTVSFATWRQNPGFVDATLVTLEAPPNLMGNYHLASCASSACELGAASASAVNAPATDYDNQARPTGAGFDAGADEFGAVVVPPPPHTTQDLYFSTAGNINPSGVAGTADDSDVYNWNGTAFSRRIDVSAAPYNVPLSANVDGFVRVDATHFYMSFTGNVTIPRFGTVADEDVLYWNGTGWSLWFDGSTHGLGGVDLGAISIVGTTLYFTTNNTAVPPLAGGTTGDNADIYRWNAAAPGNSYTRVVDASAAPYNLPNTGTATSATNPNVDGLVFVDATHFYLSFSNATTTMPGGAGGLGSVQDEDVVYFNAGTWSVSFDGTSNALTADGQDLDAISFAGGALAPPSLPAFSPLYFSTAGTGAIPGLPTPFDYGDVYFGNGTGYSREFDSSASGVPTTLLGAGNVDGFDRVDATHFYLSFSSTTYLPGLPGGFGTPGGFLADFAEDEDVLYYSNGAWSMYFDGSAHGLGGNENLDLDAISVVGPTNLVTGAGGTLHFSTLGSINPGTVSNGGSADDADIYRYNGGTSYTRVVDASAAPYNLPTNPGTPTGVTTANVDGLVFVDADHFYLSFSNLTTVVPGLGSVQDEDVVYYNAGTWSVYFDGTAQGLTADNQDVDAFDVPVTP